VLREEIGDMESKKKQYDYYLLGKEVKLVMIN
jgi:hypothetical protein